MNNWKNIAKKAAACAATLIVLALPAWCQPANTKSAPSSNSSAIRAVTDDPLKVRKKIGSDITAACMAAAIELERSRELITAVDNENHLLKERLDTEKNLTSILEELTQTQKAESNALRAAIAAKNETISAKDAVIAAQDKLTSELKTKRPSPWRRLGDVLIGAATIALLK
jgi:septal ring factor EnvC (AmiA/AmiB activator)